MSHSKLDNSSTSGPSRIWSQSQTQRESAVDARSVKLLLWTLLDRNCQASTLNQLTRRSLLFMTISMRVSQSQLLLRSKNRSQSLLEPFQREITWRWDNSLIDYKMEEIVWKRRNICSIWLGKMIIWRSSPPWPSSPSRKQDGTSMISGKNSAAFWLRTRSRVGTIPPWRRESLQINPASHRPSTSIVTTWHNSILRTNFTCTTKMPKVIGKATQRPTRLTSMQKVNPQKLNKI